MELSCKSEYALVALLELAGHFKSGEPLQIRQIAAQQDIPERYLEQLLATLRRAGFVRSQRGAKGGYLLTREPWKITLLEIVNCIEGLDAQSQKAATTPSRTTEGSVVLSVWQEARQASETVLRGYTLQDLADRRDSQRQLDLMYYI